MALRLRADRLYLRRENVWLGTSIAEQADADRNIPKLLGCRNLSPVLFISAEPLIGAVDFEAVQVPNAKEGLRFNSLRTDDSRYFESAAHLDWVIVGGESGHGARACRQTWIRDIVRQCADSEVACFVKQLGLNAEEGFGVNRKLNLHDNKGGDWDEWPESLRVRKFPVLEKPYRSKVSSCIT